MAEFLALLGKINPAMCVAIFAVCLLRRPVRAAFQAQIAYGLWLLVPVAVLASLLPPRAIMVVMEEAKLPNVASAELPNVAGAIQPILSVPNGAPLDWTWLVFAFWLVGAAAMAYYLMRLQYKFHAAERAGVAGPAVTGFFRPRIVMPICFEAQFSAREQMAILAHERAHLARQDARINALVAVLRCLCWFNPLVHLGAAWLRRDQELACDAAALREVSRLDYAKALLKSQIPAVALPLGCAWSGSEHPLTERVALLKCQPPKSARRWIGVAMVTLAAAMGGLGAWAAQPPVVRVVEAPARAEAKAGVDSVQAHALREVSPEQVHTVTAQTPRLPVRMRPVAESAVETDRQANVMVAQQATAPRADNPSADELSQMAALGIDQRYRDDIALSGYPGLTNKQLRQFKMQNVKGSWLRELASLGYASLSPLQVTNMAIQNVTADFVRRAAQAGDNPSADELIQMAMLGIDQRYRDDIALSGYPGLTNKQLRQFKMQNVKGSWLRELASLGYANLSPRQVTSMAIHNVSADFVRRAAQANSARHTPEQLVNMRIHGVMPDQSTGPPGGKSQN